MRTNVAMATQASAKTNAASERGGRPPCQSARQRANASFIIRRFPKRPPRTVVKGTKLMPNCGQCDPARVRKVTCYRGELRDKTWARGSHSRDHGAARAPLRCQNHARGEPNCRSAH